MSSAIAAEAVYCLQDPAGGNKRKLMMTDGVILREAKISDAPTIAKVEIDSWRTTYIGVLPDDFLSGLSYEEQINRWKKILSRTGPEEFVYVAEAESGQIVGYARGGPERSNDPLYEAELHAIYLLQSHQRKGIGRRLTRLIVERLAQAGFHSMLVQGLKENTACRFYEALRGKESRIEPYEIGGVTLDFGDVRLAEYVTPVAPQELAGA